MVQQEWEKLPGAKVWHSQGLFRKFVRNRGGELWLYHDHDSIESTNAENKELVKPFTLSEFKKELLEMHSDKPLGPYDLNLAFYKKFWHLCWMEVYTAEVNWLEWGIFPTPLTDLILS